KASPVEMMSIRKMITEVIDKGGTVAKSPHTIGPLKFAKAINVADIIRDVYTDAINSNTVATQAGFGPFGGGRQTQPTLDADGNPRGSALSVTYDDQTNSVIVSCSDALFKDIDILVKQLDDAARDNTKVVQFFPVKGVDPRHLQDVIDAIQGRTPSSQRGQGGGMGGGFGGGQFGGGFGGMDRGPFGGGGGGGGRGGARG